MVVDAYASPKKNISLIMNFKSFYNKVSMSSLTETLLGQVIRYNFHFWGSETVFDKMLRSDHKNAYKIAQMDS